MQVFIVGSPLETSIMKVNLKYQIGHKVAVRYGCSYEFGVIENYQEGCYQIKVTGFLNQADTEASTWYMNLTEEDVALTPEELGFKFYWSNK